MPESTVANPTRRYGSRKWLQTSFVIVRAFVSLWIKALDSTALVTLVFGCIRRVCHGQCDGKESAGYTVKNLKQFLVNLAAGFVALNIFGALLCTGESFPVPVPKTVTVTVPYSVP